MINPLKVLLFLAGGTAVVGAGAYVSGALDPLFSDAPQAVADLPAESAPAGMKPVDPAAPKEDRVEQAPGEAPAATGQPATDASQPPAATASDAGQAPATPPPAAADQTEIAAAPPAEAEAPADAQKPADVAAVNPQAPPASETPAPAAGPSLPSFDIVRVETDGSMVIAGKAAPNAKVELIAGGKVIGGATAGIDGDFVVVLDDPLAPGDYQITIRSTAADGSATQSTQTAIVSVPAEAGGQVLAMIEEPGKPSEIITVPQPAVAAGESPAAAKPDQVAAAQPGTPADQAAAAAPADAASGDAATKPAAGTEAQTPSAGGTADAGAQPPSGMDVAAASPDAAKPTPEAPAVAAVDVAVEAVEIDGSKVFVAGRAPAGATVRVYANEILLGDALASPAGRFLVEATQDLPVGDYVVRADVLGADGAEVVARAAVPFVREPGESIAAVAPPADAAPADQKPVDMAAADTGAGTAGELPAPPAAAAAPAPQPDQVDAAPATAEPAPAADGQAAAPAATADAAGTAEQPAPSATAQMPAPAAGEQPPSAAVTPTPPGADEQQTPAVAAEAPASTADSEAKPADSSQPAASAEASATPPAAAPAAESEAAPPAASADAAPPAATQAPVAETTAPPATDATAAPAPTPPSAGGTVVAAAPPTEVTAPPLQKVDSAVIIRRGDTLWRISKRVYGRGVRYSTIYLANQDQIRDPDMIWPGQVFTVPDKTGEGETADLSKIGGQVVPKTQ